MQLLFHNNIAGTTTQNAIRVSYITMCRGGGIIHCPWHNNYSWYMCIERWLSEKDL